MYKLLRNKKAQSTVEYVVILLVIVGLVIFLGGPLKKKAGELVENVFSKITGQLGGEGASK